MFTFDNKFLPSNQDISLKVTITFKQNNGVLLP